VSTKKPRAIFSQVVSSQKICAVNFSLNGIYSSLYSAGTRVVHFTTLLLRNSSKNTNAQNINANQYHLAKYKFKVDTT